MCIYVLKAMPEPSPAKTKMSIEINSAKAALRASAWPASAADPTAMREIGIFYCFANENKNGYFDIFFDLWFPSASLLVLIGIQTPIQRLRAGK